MLQLSVEAVVRDLDGAFARIWTLDERRNVLKLQASAGFYTRPEDEQFRVPVCESEIGLIAEERKPYLDYLLNDNLITRIEWAREQKLISFAGYPSSWKGVWSVCWRSSRENFWVKTLSRRWSWWLTFSRKALSASRRRRNWHC